LKKRRCANTNPCRAAVTSIQQGDISSMGPSSRLSSFRFRWASAFTLLFLAISAVPVFAVAADSDDSGEDPNLVLPAAQELESKRTATSQTFRLDNGARETRIYTAPIN